MYLFHKKIHLHVIVKFACINDILVRKKIYMLYLWVIPYLNIFSLSSVAYTIGAMMREKILPACGVGGTEDFSKFEGTLASNIILM